MSLTRGESYSSTVTTERSDRGLPASLEIASGVTVLEREDRPARLAILRALQTAIRKSSGSLTDDLDGDTVSISLDEAGSADELTDSVSRPVNSADSHSSPASVTSSRNSLLFVPELLSRYTFEADTLRNLCTTNPDIREIQDAIAELTSTVREINHTLADIETAKRRLDALETKRSALRDERRTLRKQLQTTETKIDATPTPVREDAEKIEPAAENDSLGEICVELRTFRRELTTITETVQIKRETIDELNAEYDELDDELANLSGEDCASDGGLKRARKQKRRIDREIQELQRTIQAHEALLESTEGGIASNSPVSNGSAVSLNREDGALAPVARGTERSPETVEDNIESLRTALGKKLDVASDVDERVNELESRKKRANRRDEKEKRLTRRMSEIETAIEEHENDVRELRLRERELIDRVVSHDVTVGEYADDIDGELVSLHRDANRLQFTLRKIDVTLANPETGTDALEALIDRESTLKERRRSLTSDVEERRDEISHVRSDLVPQFNTFVDILLQRLDHETLDTIHVYFPDNYESGRRGAGSSMDPELSVDRATSNGTETDVAVDTLPESEAQVVSLLLALAGYFVHDVHEETPVLLFDSLTCLSIDQTTALVEYCAKFTEYIVIGSSSNTAAELRERLT